MEQFERLDPNEVTSNRFRKQMRTLVADLGKQATLTLADLYATEDMGVEFSSSNQETIAAERDALMRNIGQATALWLQLEALLVETERGIGSLQYLLDPESN